MRQGGILARFNEGKIGESLETCVSCLNWAIRSVSSEEIREF